MPKTPKTIKPTRKRGRPSSYSDALAAKICERLAEVAVDRLNACLPKVEVSDVYGAKALAETVAILVKLAGEVERGQATGADAHAGQRCEP